jgi:hypothetical protein
MTGILDYAVSTLQQTRVNAIFLDAIRGSEKLLLDLGEHCPSPNAVSSSSPG